MHLLAASEAKEPAFELRSLGNSVLTYALFQEGLQEHNADFSPRDGRIELREWLSYGAGRAQTLFRERKAEKRLVPGSSFQPAQHALFAPRLVPEANALVLLTEGNEPGGAEGQSGHYERTGSSFPKK